jgi:hypothetical protein
MAHSTPECPGTWQTSNPSEPVREIAANRYGPEGFLMLAQPKRLLLSDMRCEESCGLFLVDELTVGVADD